MKNLVYLVVVFLLSSCAGTSPLDIARGLLGYIPPPEETTIAEELKLEFKRCETIDPNRNCAQIAYDTVRTVKGLEPRKVPKGVVIILEGDVDMPKKDEDKQEDKP